MRRGEGVRNIMSVGEKGRTSMLGGFAADRKARAGRQAGNHMMVKD